MQQVKHTSCSYTLHARIQKVLSERVQIGQFFFLVDEGREDRNTTPMWAIIGPPAKCHLNGIPLAC